MSGFTFRPAVRQATPIITGLAGPSKSGKTKSAHRLAVGLARKKNKKVAMINTEGPKGHQYADEFSYLAVDMEEPFTLKKYTEAIQEAAKINPDVLIIDSMSHAHEGIGGMLDQHEKELDRLAGDDYSKRLKMTWAAWVKPKADEAIMINTILQMKCHVILCFRAKEKIKIVKGKEPVDLGWQPIASDRIHFETAFTLILPPHSKGTPDLSMSEFRDPYDTMIQAKQLDEELGLKLDEWATGGKAETIKVPHDTSSTTVEESPDEGQALQDAKNAGMITEEKQELEIIATVKREVLSYQKRKEVMDYYNANRALWKKNYLSKTFSELTRIVNDRLEQVK